MIRLLLVEDDVLVARAVARLLSRHFDIVDVVDDVHTALLRLEVDQIDIVVTDYNLGAGRPTGLDLARYLRAHERALPIVLVSGSLDDTLREQALVAGIRECLTKPVAALELVAAIRRLAPTQPVMPHPSAR